MATQPQTEVKVDRNHAYRIAYDRETCEAVVVATHVVEAIGKFNRWYRQEHPRRAQETAAGTFVDSITEVPLLLE